MVLPISSTFEQSSVQDHRRTNKFNELNHYDWNASRTHQNKTAEGFNYTKNFNNIIPRLYGFTKFKSNKKSNLSAKQIEESRESSLQRGGKIVSNPYQRHIFIEGNFDLGVHGGRTSSNLYIPGKTNSSKTELPKDSISSNINSFALPLLQQNSRVCSNNNISNHCKIEESSSSKNPMLNDPLNFNDPKEKDSLKSELEKTLLQTREEILWKTRFVPPNPFYRMNGKFKSYSNSTNNFHENNSTTTLNRPDQNNPFSFSMYLPRMQTRICPEQQMSQGFNVNNFNDLNQNRLFGDNPSQKIVYENVIPANTTNNTNACYSLWPVNRFDQEINNCTNLFNNLLLSSTTSPNCQSQNRLSSDYHLKDNVFEFKYSQGRPILNRTFVNGDY